MRLRALISGRSLPFEVFNDYPLLPGTRWARSADLVIRKASKEALVAAEFKYEPSHRRAEFVAMPGKLPVVFWGPDGVAKDVIRIREFVEAGVALAGFAVFIDEGRTSAIDPHIPERPGATGTPVSLTARHRRSCGQAGRLPLTNDACYPALITWHTGPTKLAPSDCARRVYWRTGS